MGSEMCIRDRDNDLFYEDKTMMLFGDGKKMMNELNSAIKDL